MSIRKYFKLPDNAIIMQGSKLLLIRSPMRVTFSPWRIKNSGLVATLATRFLYDLDLN